MHAHACTCTGFLWFFSALHVSIASASVMFTADEGVRGGKIIPLKKMADEALEGCDCVKKVYIYKRTGADVPMKSGRDVFLDDVSEILHNIISSVVPVGS